VIVLPSMALVTLEFTLTTGMVLLVVSMLLLGFGVGAVSSSMLVMLQASTTQETMGQATAVHQFSRNIGYTMAAALVGALVVNAIESSVDPATAERVLAGDDTSADASLGAAVATGFQWTGIVMFCFVTVGAVIAWRLHRATAAEGRHRRAP
jgi:surface antigen